MKSWMAGRDTFHDRFRESNSWKRCTSKHTSHLKACPMSCPQRRVHTSSGEDINTAQKAFRGFTPPSRQHAKMHISMKYIWRAHDAKCKIFWARLLEVIPKHFAQMWYVQQPTIFVFVNNNLPPLSKGQKRWVRKKSRNIRRFNISTNQASESLEYANFFRDSFHRNTQERNAPGKMAFFLKKCKNQGCSARPNRLRQRGDMNLTCVVLMENHLGGWLSFMHDTPQIPPDKHPRFLNTFHNSLWSFHCPATALNISVRHLKEAQKGRTRGGLWAFWGLGMAGNPERPPHWPAGPRGQGLVWWWREKCPVQGGGQNSKYIPFSKAQVSLKENLRETVTACRKSTWWKCKDCATGGC